MKTHELKTVSAPYAASKRGEKWFEIRIDDRGYEVGDLVVLKEWNPITGDFTGDQLPARRITYVLRDAPQFGLRPGFCVLGLAAVPPPAAKRKPNFFDVMAERGRG